MAIQSSFPTVAEQVLTLNKNVIELLTKINSITTSKEQAVSVQIFDETGVLRNFNLPTLNALKSEIDRLNSNISSMLNLDGNGSMIQSAPGIFRKVIAVDLNKEPIRISELGPVTNFVATNNWFFDSMINPMLSVQFDLTNRIDNNVRKVMSRRYIVEFEKDSAGAFTPNGQSALNSFNSIYRDNINIDIADFETWHKTTPGVLNGSNPKIDDQMFELEPNELMMQGVFTPTKTQEDRVNRKLWYYLDTLDYLNTVTNKIEQLQIGMELIVNVDRSSTRYRIVEINTNEALPKVRFDRVEGNQPIPVGVIGSLKINSDVITTKIVRVSIGYDERSVIFMKAIDPDSHVFSTEWSPGTGYYSNTLRLNSNNNDNGKSMEAFYTEFVYDYGTVLKDLVVKKIPNTLGGTVPAPTMVSSNFKVVQINKHITDTPDSKLLKQKFNYQTTLKSEIQQLQEAIINRNKKAKIEKYASDSDRKKAMMEIDELTKRKDSKSKLLATVTQEILDLSKNPMSKIGPKFAVRGFITIPDPVIVSGTKSQEIVQFKIQYKYLSKSGSESPTEQYSVDNTQNTGAYSNWIEYMTPARKRIFNPATGGYTWEVQDVSNADVPNINQIDISIQANEKIQFRVKSISEVGWPESPLESDWSDIVEVDFPSDLNNVQNENENIKKDADKEDLKNTVMNDLASKGLDQHLADTTVIGDRVYMHDSDSILSGFKDANGVSISLFDYLRSLQDRIRLLEEKVLLAKGQLKVFVYRENDPTEVVNDGDKLIYQVSCENECRPYTNTALTSNRTYANDIYVIDKFQIKIQNKSIDSPLGLVSSMTYTSGDNYATNLPQVFWVNTNNEFITKDDSSQTKTQIDNQFVWSVNFDTAKANEDSKLAENIGNDFQKNNSNSISKILSSEKYNVGYGGSNRLAFVGENKALQDPAKWIDVASGVQALNLFQTTVHPVTPTLEDIRETNSEKTRQIAGMNEITIPVKIFFKINAMDNTQEQDGSRYVIMSNFKQTIIHRKKVSMLIKNVADNRSFKFTVEFVMTRNNTDGKSTIDLKPYVVKSTTP